MKKKWTKKDEAYLKRHWQEMSDQELAETMGWSPCTIRDHRYKLRLIRDRHTNCVWTKEETDIVRENYPYMCNKAIADLLGWSKSDRQVSTKGTLLGLRKVYKHNMEWMAEHDEEIRAMYEKHMTDMAISFVLGVSVSLVQKYRVAAMMGHRYHVGSRGVVEQYTPWGVKVAEYKSSIEAGRAMGASNGANIRSCIYGKTKTAYGFIWRYKS